MKKCLLTIASILLISSLTYAVDFSIGITAGGWGPTFVRGTSDDAKMFNNKDEDKFDGFKRPLNYNMAFAPVAQITGQVDIIPFFGIELGLGYSMKSIGFSFDGQDSDGKDVVSGYKMSINQLSIPLLLKGQYEIADMVNIYVGVGPKFNFNILAPTRTEYTDGKKNETDDNPYKAEKEEYNMFDMDLSFAIGAEYKIAGAHYLGLRVGYDMNLLGTMKEYKRYEDTTTGDWVDKYEGRNKFYADDLAISLTYRYKFGQ